MPEATIVKMGENIKVGMELLERLKSAEPIAQKKEALEKFSILRKGR